MVAAIAGRRVPGGQPGIDPHVPAGSAAKSSVAFVGPTADPVEIPEVACRPAPCPAPRQHSLRGSGLDPAAESHRPAAPLIFSPREIATHGPKVTGLHGPSAQSAAPVSS